MIRYGVGIFTGYLALPLVVPLVSRTVLPVIKRLPITSAYEYLERRFDVSVRSLSACAFIVRTLLWMGLVIYMTSFRRGGDVGLERYVTILVTGVLTAVYTSVGGMRTVIWTDNFQMLILFGGAIAIPVLIGVLLGSGPGTWWQTFSQAGASGRSILQLGPHGTDHDRGNLPELFLLEHVYARLGSVGRATAVKHSFALNPPAGRFGSTRERT